MSLLDLGFITLVLVTAVRPWTPWRHRPWIVASTTFAPLLAASAHLLVSGLRWQIAPLHLAALIVAMHGPFDLRRSVPRRLATFAVIGLSAVAGFFAWALPVTALPAPSGDAPVGTRTYVMSHDRPDDQARRIVVQFWYPAAAGTADEPVPWLADQSASLEAFAREHGLPRFGLGHLDRIRGHAHADVAVAAGRHPLVIVSHGWSGMRALHSSLAESLASHGYIVAAIDHTGAALVTTFPDGEVVGLEHNLLPAGAPTERYEAAASRLVGMFAADVELVLDNVAEAVDEDLSAAIDANRIGLVGHSTGGAAAYLACSRQPSCAATVGLDPWVEPLPDELVGAGLDLPVLSLRSEEWLDTPNDKRLRRLHAGSTAAQGRVTVAGTLHRDFTMLPLLSPLSAPLGLSGSTPPRELHAIIDEWTVGFFDHHLRGEGADPLHRPTQDPRVDISR